MGASALDCREFAQRLWTFLDGELDDGICRELRAHLENCVECWEHYRFEGKLRAFVRRCCQEPAPEIVRRRVIRFIARLTAREG
ncbi:MAG: mycothiol system anti-sigma-R factor [Armatimonadetes bacterium]|nr:mycothiol system anti-sigma-R factor [Armatimonadota bacterium]MDW8154465.1 mycothiol system anti-sigma-R factor [Armatimonadota bacterium]